jgi:hypothetical protein
MNNQKEEFHLGKLISITRRNRYGAIDVETLRDGGWWMPQTCVQKIHATLTEYALYPFDFGERGFYARRVPLTVMDEVVGKLAAILSHYRCDHATWRDLKGSV